MTLKEIDNYLKNFKNLYGVDNEEPLFSIVDWTVNERCKNQISQKIYLKAGIVV